MCGRYGLNVTPQIVSDFFDIETTPNLPPRYNIAPTQDAPVVRRARDGRRTLSMMRWGLVPFWAKDVKIGAKMINARAETVPTLPAFREAFEARRCLVPADGFYEWKKDGKARRPFRIGIGDGGPSPSPGCGSAGVGHKATRSAARSSAPSRSSPPRPTPRSRRFTRACL